MASEEAALMNAAKKTSEIHWWQKRGGKRVRFDMAASNRARMHVVL